MTDSQTTEYYDYLIIGGGIAGVVCAETLCELISPSKFAGAFTTGNDIQQFARVAVISASQTVKTTINLRRITNLIESFDVEETSGEEWSETWPSILSVIYDTVLKIDPLQHHVYLSSRGMFNPINYGKLCIATGGIPRLIDSSNPLVIGLRDTESIQTFQNRLRGTRRLMLVGNGGIATEIAYEVTGCQIIWAIKDASISAPFLDPAAAKFLLDSIDSRRRQQHQSSSENVSPDHGSGDNRGKIQIRRMRYVVGSEDPNISPDSNGTSSVQFLNLVPADQNGASREGVIGSALGPDWAHGRALRGQLENSTNDRFLKVVSGVRVKRILSAQEMHDLNYSGLVEPFENQSLLTSDNQWPVFVELTNNQIYGCDLIVSAIGVDATGLPSRPNKDEIHRAEFFGASFDRAPAQAGGGLLINDQMQTSVQDVYAAGDCAYANWTWSPHWFQMRLWNQARQMAFQAAKCMHGHSNGINDVPLDFSFELFTHVTYFFGFKVVLLGLFNGQGLDLTSSDCYLLMRVTPGQEYVKCVMKSGRMQGALLIGETDLEETLENLILNQLDLTNLEDRLLDPDVDLSDYFD